MQASVSMAMNAFMIVRPTKTPDFRSGPQTTYCVRGEPHFVCNLVGSQSRKALGTAALMRIDPTHGTTEVGCIAPSRRTSSPGCGAVRRGGAGVLDQTF